MKKIATLLATSIAAVTLAVIPANPASAHYGHYCGTGSHQYYQDGNTWRETLIRDEGTRHTYRVQVWFDAPWYDFRGDRWLHHWDTVRTCYTGGWV